MGVTVCLDPEEMFRELQQGAGALLLSDEVLAEQRFGDRVAQSRGQPAWSELPILMLTAEGDDSCAAAFAMQSTSNVVLLQRPVRPAALIGAARLALRASGREFDITELRRAEAALQENRQRLTGIIDSAMDAIITVDGAQRIVLFNPAAEQMFRCPAGEAIGSPIDRFIPPRLRAIHREHILHFAGTGDTSRAMGHLRPLSALRSNGEEFTIEASISQVEVGGTRLLTVILRDISERQRMEEALRASEAQLRLQAAALDAAPNAISLSKTDPDGTIVWVNQAFTALTGYSAGEAIGHSHHMLSSGEQNEGFYRDLWKTIGRGELWRGELVNRRKDGTIYHEEMGITPLRDTEGKLTHYVAVKQDITARKRAEAALRESEARYRALFDSIDEGFCVIEVIFDEADEPIDYRFLEINPSFERQTGLRDARGRTMRELAPKHEEHWFEIYGRIALTGEPVRFTERAEELHRWYDVFAFRLGRPEDRQVAVLFNDISERKTAEEAVAAARDKAEQASQAKDHFLAVLSHELRNPLALVTTAAAMLQKRLGTDPDAQRMLEIIRRNVDLEARLIDDLLDMTRIARGKVELHKRPVPLGDILRWAVEVCTPDMEARCLHFGLDIAEPPSVLADPARLQQVFWNLLKNSVKFAPPGGCVGLRCRQVNGEAIVEVSDSGEGIEPEALERIFSAFEQANRAITRRFGGLGLGLAISKALVELHGGTIQAHSTGKGQGATFSVHLPVLAATGAQAERAPTAVTIPAKAVAGRPLRILLVEDHKDTANMMRQLLMLSGHTVEHAGDVAGALSLADEQRFDLVISDLGLPDASGLELMQNLRARGWSVPAIAISGYGSEMDIARSRQAGFVAHVTKPPSPEALFEAIAASAG